MTYSSSVAMNRRRYVRRNQNTVTAIVDARKLGPISNTIILIVLLCLIGLLYLTQVTKTNNFGYTINSLEQHQSDLKSQQSDLEVASARLQSLDQVSRSQVAKNLVPVSPSGSIR